MNITLNREKFCTVPDMVQRFLRLTELRQQPCDASGVRRNQQNEIFGLNCFLTFVEKQ
jgi:hypothetical protein